MISRLPKLFCIRSLMTCMCHTLIIINPMFYDICQEKQVY